MQALRKQPGPKQAVVPALTELAFWVGRQEINTEASKICVKAKCSGGKEQERGIGSIKIEEGHPCEVTCE